MEPNCKDKERDELSAGLLELAAALGETSQWVGLDPDADISAPITLNKSSPGNVPPSSDTPAPLVSVTVGVAGANGGAWDVGIDECVRPCADHAYTKQLRIGLPVRFLEALSTVPERLRTRVLLAAVFGPLGHGSGPGEFLAAAIQLERSGNILRQVRHLGLPAEYDEEVDKICRWIGQACNLRRDDSESYCPRLPAAQAQALLALKPRERDEFARLVLSFVKAGISVSGLLDGECRIRSACDCITWNLERVHTVVPVAETIPLIITLGNLQERGAP